MTTARVVAVVLNTNRCDDTVTCLRSLEKSNYPNLGIIVLDNASTDGSVAKIQADFPSVQLVNLEENLGYAGNNNVGIKLAIEQGADWVFVLNEDTIVSPTCLDILVNSAQAMRSPGIIGPMVYTFGSENIISSAGGKIDWWRADGLNVGMGEVDYGQYQRHPVDFINGCGMLVSRKAVEKAGLLDESFFIYYEETDWCARIRKMGFDIWFEPQAQMRHKAPIESDKFGPTTLYYFTRNRIRFFSRHAPILIRPVVVLRAIRGAMKGIEQHKEAGRLEHAEATRWAIKHALQRRWGKVDATLWRSDLTDRSLHSTTKPLNSTKV